MAHIGGKLGSEGKEDPLPNPSGARPARHDAQLHAFPSQYSTSLMTLIGREQTDEWRTIVIDENWTTFTDVEGMVALATPYCLASYLSVMLEYAAWISARIFGVVVACIFSFMSMNFLTVELLKKFSGG